MAPRTQVSDFRLVASIKDHSSFKETEFTNNEDRSFYNIDYLNIDYLRLYLFDVL